MPADKQPTSSPATTAPVGTIPPDERPRRTISLGKGKHTFAFRYAAGEENVVLAQLADMAKRRDLPFDWFDAAVLSHQLGQHLSKELQAFLPKKVA